MLGCTHSDLFATPPISIMPPFSTGSDVQITFNVDQDYWPTWNGDGKGILYAYVDREWPLHRCLGMLAPAGGTRLWQLCDNRAVRDDSMTSFAAFAMDTAGHLLVAEAVSSIHEGFIALPLTSLWLADAAHPYVRTTRLTMPITIGSTPITWLADLAWTGPNTFIVFGQLFETVPHCVEFIIGNKTAQQCLTRDTVLADPGGVVLRGTIAAGRATLQAIAGTEHATSYSLAEDGTSIVFTLTNHVQLFKMPAAGGAPTPTPVGTTTSDSVQLVGVSCKGTTCIVARDSLLLTDVQRIGFVLAQFSCVPPFGPVTPPFTVPLGTMELHGVSLNTGAEQLLGHNIAHVIDATPRISPVNGGVLQIGGGWGHLPTFATNAMPILWYADGNSVLHLYKNVVP